MYARPNAFTLIELLVVIAIIGVLSSVVLASLNSARNKARTETIKSQALELRKLFELQYADTGSYGALNRGWATPSSCASEGYSGSYASQAVAICESLADLITNPSANGHMHLGVSGSGGTNNNTHYSIMVRLPSNTYFCIGSSGAISDTETGSTWTAPGCYANP